MGFYADLHVHSKHSRATSEGCGLEELAAWARRKGVALVGTGDFTHPKWLEEIEEKLVPAEPGLFRLRPDLDREAGAALGGVDAPPARFVLEVEISTIYKSGDRTRKVHHLVYAPDLDAAKRFAGSLARIGNIASDGRPILGLDSRDLLEVVLEAGEGCYLIPAHIWTPWFAALGSKSGFDSIEECYRDLAGHIFAVETGLSSDPPMNRRLSSLDRFALISSSDAHSPSKIGREACVFETDLDYHAVRRALETGEGYGGTVEFFAEEGKYHFDGHRKCGVCLAPEETERAGGLCPVCGKPVTLGVLHRVHELADRGEDLSREAAGTYRSFVPLEELLAEVEGVGPKAKSVERLYDRLLRELGPELWILDRVPLEDIRRASSDLVAEAVARVRSGRVIREPGYDGEYGRIRVFSENELGRWKCAGPLLELCGVGLAEPAATPEEPVAAPGPSVAATPASEGRARGSKGVAGSRPARPPAAAPKESVPAAAPAPGAEETPAPASQAASAPASARDVLSGLDPEQRAAAEIARGPLAIIAGPGTGKTRTLTHRIAHLVLACGAAPEECLAIAFTRRAAEEIAGRLERLLGDRARRAPVHTFHSLGLSILREEHALAGFSGPPRVAGGRERSEIASEALGVSSREARRVLERVSRAKRSGGEGADPETAAALAAYDAGLRERGLADFDDLIALPVRILEGSEEAARKHRARYRWVSVDEFQDIDPLQYRLLRMLVAPDGNVCAIGDPDQSIYAFRGADAGCFRRFFEDFPGAATVALSRSYRLSKAVAEASLDVVARESLVPGRRLVPSSGGADRIEIRECATERAEAEMVVHAIEKAIGGSGFFSMDSGRVEEGEGEELSFGDFAVLYRMRAQAEPLAEAFARSGIPFQERTHRPLAEVPAVEALLSAMEALARGERVPEGPEALIERAREGLGEEAPGLEPYLPALRSIARRRGGDLQGFLADVALSSDADLWDPRAEAVSLLTLHAAKGLEFRTVFIVGCEDGILPLSFDGEEGDLAEERRLLFVGMTRAKERLVLSWARRRLLRGRAEARRPSPFLEDIRKELLERARAGRAEKPRPAHRQLTIFDDA